MNSITSICEITGISKRALHHYDDIGLLSSKRKQNGYRVYDADDIERLKHILLFKEMGFSLKQIKQLLDDTDFDYQQALLMHKKALSMIRDRLNRIICQVEDEIKGVRMMSLKELDIDEMSKVNKLYEKETKAKWGNSEEYKQSQTKNSKYTREDWLIIQDEANGIFDKFAVLDDITSKKAKSIVDKWKSHITKYYYECQDSILLVLADMYVCDERFQTNIDKRGKGTAKIMSESIKYHCR